MYVGKKYLKFFPVGSFFCMFQIKCLTDCLIFKNLPCPEKFLVTHLQNQMIILVSFSTTFRSTSSEVFLKILQDLQENTCGKVSILIKLQSWCLQLHQYRESDTGVFQWILKTFSEHLFYRTPLGDCFWRFSTVIHCFHPYLWTSIWYHSFNTYGKFSEKRTFLTPWYAHVCTCAYHGVKNVSFSENFAYVLN